MLRVVEAVQRTDTGRAREANEDAYFARAPVFVVADGMGGAQAGEVASQLAVEAFEPDRDDAIAPEEYLRATARAANRRIFELAEGDSSRSGMGTTLTAALVSGDEVSFGHVGDSRAYVFRDGNLKQLTNDHSLVEELRRQGRLTRDQAAEHPQRSVITRALGPEPEVVVDTMTFRARPEDVFLICSDGLTTMLADADIAAILARSGDLGGAAHRLVRAANDRGGRDNITVVLFRVAEAGVEESDEPATLIGPSAEEAGFTAAAVSEAAAAQEAEGPLAPSRRRAPAPSPPAAPRRSWPRRALKTLAVLAALTLIVGGGLYGLRQVWFLGADEGGRVALYRGLPYDLPFGIELYSERYSSPITLAALPSDRRAAATDHELRSRGDAVSLIEDLENAAAASVPARPPAPDRKGSGSKGGKSSPQRKRGGSGSG